VSNQPTSPWQDQLQAESPCYDVNLLDGLDHESTVELWHLFECLNYDGHFDAWLPVVETIDVSTASDRPIGLALIDVLDALPTVDLDPFLLADTLLSSLQDEERPIESTLNLILELIRCLLKLCTRCCVGVHEVKHFELRFCIDSHVVIKQTTIDIFLALISCLNNHRDGVAS
jgi:hypothetical protein